MFAAALLVAMLTPPNTPLLAQRAALADLRTLRPHDQVFTRYVWNQWGVHEDAKQIALTLNYVSRAEVLYEPPVVAGGYLVRVDLRRLTIVDREEDLKEFIQTWEELAFDPFFSTLITPDTIGLLAKTKGLPKGIWGVDKKNKIWTGSDEAGWKEQDVLRLNGIHLDPFTEAELQQRTRSSAPVTHRDYVTNRMLSSIKGQGVYKQVFGGLYYDFSGIKKSNIKGVSDEDILFDSLGIGDSQKGVTAKVIYERTRTDRRVATFESQVTGKPRRVDMLETPAGWAWVTHDPGDQDIDAGQDPFRNLEEFKDRAREIIFVKRNELPGYALYGGNGELQESAPADVVADHEIPAPYTKNLEAGISCLRCHGKDDSNGYKPLVNDVINLTKSKRIDIFGDGTDPTKPPRDRIARLAGRYRGDPTKTLIRVRHDNMESVLRVTGPWKDGGDQTDIVQRTSKRYAAMWTDWKYSGVNARKALRELGVPSDTIPNAAEAFRLKVPPVFPPEENVGYIPEDVIIGALGEGLKVTRTQWMLVYSFAAARSLKGEPRVPDQRLQKTPD